MGRGQEKERREVSIPFILLFPGLILGSPWRTRAIGVLSLDLAVEDLSASLTNRTQAYRDTFIYTSHQSSYLANLPFRPFLSIYIMDKPIQLKNTHELISVDLCHLAVGCSCLLLILWTRGKICLLKFQLSARGEGGSITLCWARQKLHEYYSNESRNQG